MKIINNNNYKIMYGLKFIKPGEVVEIDNKSILEFLLKQPGIEEYVSTEDTKKLEEENKKLKEELEKVQKTTKKETKKSKKDK